MADPSTAAGTIRDGGLGHVIANNGSGANTAQQPVAAVDLYGNLAVMTEGTGPRSAPCRSALRLLRRAPTSADHRRGQDGAVDAADDHGHRRHGP